MFFNTTEPYSFALKDKITYSYIHKKKKESPIQLNKKF